MAPKKESESPKCSICHRTDMVKNGTKTNRQGIWQIWLCNNGCGHVQKGDKITVEASGDES